MGDAIRAWRIVKSKHARGAFSGEGARLAGGRWNSAGTAVVYGAGSESLSMLELLMHLQSEDLLKSYVMFEMVFSEKLVMTQKVGTLPRNWRSSPPPVALQRLGDAWVKSGVSAVLRVPSVVVESEWNYLFNPAHRDFGAVAIGPRRAVKFDGRLLKRG